MNAIAAPMHTDSRVTPPPAVDRPAGALRRNYLVALGWAFTLFNTVRVVAYLPTVWAIIHSGDSSQHSLWTWCTWAGANATMAAWLYETHDRRFNRAAVVSVGNMAMCVLTLLTILAYRL